MEKEDVKPKRDEKKKQDEKPNVLALPEDKSKKQWQESIEE